MQVTIHISTGNANCQSEDDIARLLHVLADRISQSGFDYVTKVMDANGNQIGTVEVEGD